MQVKLIKTCRSLGQRKFYPLRGDWPQEVVKKTSNPAQAFENWMERDVHYGRIVAWLARKLGQTVIEVSEEHTLAENTRLVQKFFQLRSLRPA